MKILVLNSGSSSQKSCLYEVNGPPGAEPEEPAWLGKIEWDSSGARMDVRNAAGERIEERVAADSRGGALQLLLERLWTGKAFAIATAREVEVVGHRVVHGGEDFREATRVTAETKKAIAALAPIAPLHNRAELEGMEIAKRLFGEVPQVAVFDTAFHRSMPERAALYPGPFEWREMRIRRYGFHGINHEYCAERAAHLLGRELSALRIVTCHLGNGCSLAAIRGGRSVDTTMGFTPLEGLMMGTRSGSIDPAIVTHLMREKGLNAQQVDELLNQQSGLAGISGISNDMRKIVQAMREGNARAKLAFEMFVYRLRLFIGAMSAALEGLDVLVFSGGIGENSREVREETCKGLEFLGVKFDAKKNAEGHGDYEISHEDSHARALVIRAQEDWAIARECWRIARQSRQAAKT